MRLWFSILLWSAVRWLWLRMWFGGGVSTLGLGVSHFGILRYAFFLA